MTYDPYKIIWGPAVVTQRAYDRDPWGGRTLGERLRWLFPAGMPTSEIKVQAPAGPDDFAELTINLTYHRELQGLLQVSYEVVPTAASPSSD